MKRVIMWLILITCLMIGFEHLAEKAAGSIQTIESSLARIGSR